MTLTITLTAEQAANWKHARDLLGHAVPGGKNSGIMDYLARKEIRRRTGIKFASDARARKLT